MGLELTIQSLSRAAWLGTSGRDRTDPGLAQGRSRDYNPTGAKTPEEALAHIKLLSKAGRTEELATLLRSSQVFRQAWQNLQQSASTPSETVGGLISLLAAPDGADLPAPLPGAGSGGRQLSPVQNLALQPLDSSQESTSGAPTYPVLSSKPTNSLAAARRVYETQAHYYSQGAGDFSRINLRV
ncbi:MAG: hypothetical protein ACOZF2_17105 [Thermodesulfobacteriota bacterium]